MTDDRAAFTEARDTGKAIHQAQRLENATYTAVEVKALTKTALQLGRREMAEEIASELEKSGRSMGGAFAVVFPHAAEIAREIGTKEAP